MVEQAIRDLVAGRPLPAGGIAPAVVEAALRFEVGELLLGEAEAQGVEIETDGKLQLIALAMRSDARRLRAEQVLPKVGQLANDTGVRLGVFKGPANAAALYRSASLRPYNDVDLFVSSPPAAGLERLLIAMGREQASAAALVELSKRGTPVHEITVSVDGVDFDVHFNPFGFVTPVRSPERIEEEFARPFADPAAALWGPSPELALAIACVNLVRKGGGALWILADCARLVSGVGGPFNWERFERLLADEGLAPLAGQALRILREDLELDVPPALTAKKRAWWGPAFGEGQATKRLLRRGTFSILHRRPTNIAQSLSALRTWYLPPRRQRQARMLWQ